MRNCQPVKGFSRAKTFREWFAKNVDKEARRYIREHGMSNAAPSGLIYYCQTIALYKAYEDDIWEIVMGENEGLKAVMPPDMQSPTQFKNFMVWAAAELLAYQ